MFDSIEVSVMWSTLLPVFLLAVRVFPIFRSTSLPLPMILFVLVSMRRIWQSGAFHDPDFGSRWSTFSILICLLLKKLNFSCSLNGTIFVLETCSSRSFVFVIFMNVLGEPVSASQTICLLLVKVATQNSPEPSLFMTQFFSLWNVVGRIKFTFAQSSVSSLMYRAAFASTSSACSESPTEIWDRFCLVSSLMCRTLIV